ncbi:capsid portal protein [Escherichia coli]|nr:capsid portal protein [Escherichia coli]
MRFHQVHTVHNFHHVDKVHFIEHLTIDGQLRVAVGTGHFGGVAFARLPLAGIHFFVTSTHDKLHGLHFPGIVTLNRAGKAQLDAIHRGFTHLFKQQQFSTTNGKFCVQRTVIKPQIHIHRTRHSAAAILLIFAGKFRQRQRLNDPLPVVPVVKQVPVLDRRELLDYVECVQMDRWYEPPVSFDGLARTFRAAVHHSSPIAVKCNILTSTYIPHPLLSQQAFSRFVQDYLVFGNAYLEKRTNRFGEVIALEPALAKYTRRGLDLDTYWFVQYGMTTQPYQFTKGSIFHLMEPDINQEIYGLPGYLSAIPSALLNESATLFRRKYYINGSHAGFIMYMTDAAQNQEDVNNLRNAMKSAKGPGNFRNLFMYSPNGKKDGLQIIPLSEVAAKDEFLNIKNVSRDDMMAAHRVPPQMMGIMPNNVGGFGDVEKASRVFVRNELMPLQKRIAEINEWLDEEVVKFEYYGLENNQS